MSKEMLLMIDSISREKDLPKALVHKAVEEALAFAAKKKFGMDDAMFDAHIDQKTGEVTVYRKWAVREDNIIDIPNAEVARIDLEKGEGKDGFVYEQVDADFGRTSAQMAKQAIFQKIRDVEQSEALKSVMENGGEKELLTGTVKSFQKNSGGVVLEIGRLEAVMPRAEMIPGDSFKMGERVFCVIKKVEEQGTRKMVTVSRTSKEFMLALLEKEVPEIQEGEIEVVSLARAPGQRCKLVVKARRQETENYSRGMGRRQAFDPIRAIIGMKGMRVKSISEETNGEHLDILLAKDDPAEMLIQALAPAEALKIAIDEESRTMEACIDDEHLGMAIGSRGVNVRLIGELLGWTVSVMNEKEWEEKAAAREIRVVDHFMRSLSVDQEVAELLMSYGFSTVEEIAYVPMAELAEIEELDDETLAELRTRARNESQKRQFALLSSLEKAKREFSELEGISSSEIELLAKGGVSTLAELADMATDELLEVCELPERKAGDLILKARKLAWTE